MCRGLNARERCDIMGSQFTATIAEFPVFERANEGFTTATRTWAAGIEDKLQKLAHFELSVQIFVDFHLCDEPVHATRLDQGLQRSDFYDVFMPVCFPVRQVSEQLILIKADAKTTFVLVYSRGESSSLSECCKISQGEMEICLVLLLYCLLLILYCIHYKLVVLAWCK